MTGKCPMCGYQEVIQGKDVHTIMNHYVNKADPQTIICLNNKVDKIESKDANGRVVNVWIRQDIYKGVSTTIEGAVEVVSSMADVKAKQITEVKPNPFSSKPTEPLSGPI